MITLRAYSEGNGLKRVEDRDLAGVWADRSHNQVWIDFDAPDPTELALLATVCGFHPLTVEDTMSPMHQPKIDEFEDYLFMVFRSVSPIFQSEDHCLTPEKSERDYCDTLKLSAYLGKDFLVTIHTKPIPALQDFLRQVEAREMAVERHLDQMLYSIVDRMVDGVFPVLEELEERLEAIENAIFTDNNPMLLSQILRMKRELLTIRRLISPQREMLARLSRRDDFPFIQPKTTVYFRDVYDHAARIEENTIVLTDLATSIAEAHLSVSSNRMNEVMKFLTIFSTIWMPLTFIVGVYGMNFKHMPELDLPWFYPMVWVTMGAIVVVMFLFFKHKKWL